MENCKRNDFLKKYHELVILTNDKQGNRIKIVKKSSLTQWVESNKDRITRLVKEWDGKEIVFPENMVFTRYGVDTLDFHLPQSDYTIVSYIDSVGCTSCKLQFHRWRAMMYEIDSLSNRPTPYLFVFHPKNKRDFSELSYLMKRDRFDYPVWIDVEDRFNKENGLPTHVSVEQTSVDLGQFDWSITQAADFKLINQGENLLVINDVVASCGCISVDYPKQPVEAGKGVLIRVTYKAEKPEYVNKTLMVYANIESAIRLTVKGSAN